MGPGGAPKEVCTWCYWYTRGGVHLVMYLTPCIVCSEWGQAAHQRWCVPDVTEVRLWGEQGAAGWNIWGREPVESGTEETEKSQVTALPAMYYHSSAHFEFYANCCGGSHCRVVPGDFKISGKLGNCDCEPQMCTELEIMSLSRVADWVLLCFCVHSASFLCLPCTGMHAGESAAIVQG